jgi:hypothetical protein
MLGVALPPATGDDRLPKLEIGRRADEGDQPVVSLLILVRLPLGSEQGDVLDS